MRRTESARSDRQHPKQEAAIFSLPRGPSTARPSVKEFFLLLLARQTVQHRPPAFWRKRILLQPVIATKISG
jgi:hypothetical protein